MSAPYGRKSKSRTMMRKAANQKYTLPQSILCPNCREPSLPHRICMSCGFYKGKARMEQAATPES